MRIVDAHEHLHGEPGYAERLLRTMDATGIDQCCISGLGDLFRHADNGKVAAVCRQHPDRLVGAWYLRPGVGDADSVRRAADAGFRMIKVTLPKAGYDDPEYYPVWAACEELRFPVLFHTGIVTTPGDSRGERISAWNMHPMRLEPLTREFPGMNIIIAHLGIHWNDDAAELIRMRPNAYADLTGEPAGWRLRVDRVGIDRWLWWPGAWNKIVFGTDVHCTKFATILAEDIARMDSCSLDSDTRQRVFHRTIESILRPV